MGSEDRVYIFMGSYASEADAETDYNAVKKLLSIGQISTYNHEFSSSGRLKRPRSKE